MNERNVIALKGRTRSVLSVSSKTKKRRRSAARTNKMNSGEQKPVNSLLVNHMFQHCIVKRSYDRLMREEKMTSNQDGNDSDEFM